MALAKSIPILLFANSAPLPKSIKVCVTVIDLDSGSTSLKEAFEPFWLVNFSVSSWLLLPSKVIVGKYELIDTLYSCSEIFKLSLSAFNSGLVS